MNISRTISGNLNDASGSVQLIDLPTVHKFTKRLTSKLDFNVKYLENDTQDSAIFTTERL